MREAEKIALYDRDVAAIGRVLVYAPRTGALLRVAILLTLFAIAARGAFAIPAFGVAFIMLAVTLRPSRLVLRCTGGAMRAHVRRRHAIKASGGSGRAPGRAP